MRDNRIQYETKIIQAVHKDNVNNNTIHFCWGRATFGDNSNYILSVVTHNIKTNKNFLMKQVDAPTESECLVAMVEYVETKFMDENSYIVIWSYGEEEFESYFRGKDEDEVRAKFIHDGHHGVIVEIRVNELV